MLYTSITRTTELNNVYFIVDKKDNEKQTAVAIDKYFRNKIEGYMQQDVKAGRDMTACQFDEYIDLQWLKFCIGKHCGGCSNVLTLDIDDNYNISSDITAQRFTSSTKQYNSYVC